MSEGLEYSTFRYHDSQVHLLAADLHHREMRPVMGAEEFPILGATPIFDAIEQGSLGSTGCGFNMTLWAGQGVRDQPLHALVVDREIWTTGIGGGGYGVLIGKHKVYIQQNRIRVTVWRPDKSSFEVEDINRGHDGRIVGFTTRGGTNEYPKEGKYYVMLGDPTTWVNDGERIYRRMTVLWVGMFTPYMPEPDTVVLEARWPMKLKEGDPVVWTQHLGAPYVQHIVSGATGIIQAGKNRVPFLNLDPTAPHGPDNWYIRKGPRMALGASEDHRTAYICVVEGRIETSVGLRLKEMARMMLQHGIHDGVNMDGGGSAFLWTRKGGLVADSCYGDGTLEGLRPDHASVSVF